MKSLSNLQITLFVFFITAVLGSAALASDVQYEVGGGYAYFAGEQYKSLAPKTGYLVRFGAESGRKNFFNWMSNLTLVYSNDTADFTDNGNNINLNYQLVGGEFNIGFKMAFLSSVDRLPIQPYVGASGSVMSASFKFPVDAAVSPTFPKTEAQNYYGYCIFVGADVEVGRDWGINFHVEQSKIGGTLAKNPFNLDSNRILLNLFFR